MKIVKFILVLGIVAILLAYSIGCATSKPSVDNGIPADGGPSSTALPHEDTLSIEINPSSDNNIEISTPADEETFYTNLLKLVGSIYDPSATVAVNSIEAKVEKDGSFYVWLELQKGNNDIEISVTADGKAVTKTFNVTFIPALAVYLDYPQQKEGIDYRVEPLAVTGWVSDSMAAVKVNDITTSVTANGTFSAEIYLTVGTNTITAVAESAGQTDDIIYTIVLMSNGKLTSNPGAAGGTRYLSNFQFTQSIDLIAGEIRLIEVTADIRKDIRLPEIFNYTLTPVAGEYSEEPLPMPEGLQISIMPAGFTSYPNTIYHSTVVIETTTQLATGDYYFRLSWDRGGRGGGRGWILVKVR